ncbi:MAG TPA: hypothetical protein VLQ45_01590 [Thermoanaerobaculia bacterium]|nr:hypothetical protein [Thermoanaerobaculia bacterium]
MAKTSFADVMTEADGLLVKVQANAADLGYLEANRNLLAAAFEGAKEASVRQAASRAQCQQATRDLEGFLAELKEQVTRMRNGLRHQYGLKSEKLVEFGLQPRRKPQRSKENGPVPAPPPTPAPASSNKVNEP